MATLRRRADKAVRESEERLRALITASAYAVYRMNPDWSQMLALSGQAFVTDMAGPSGSWLTEYIPAADQRAVLQAINHAVGEKSTFDLKHRVRRADGSVGWTHSRAVPLLNAQGEIREWFGSASDITMQQRAEAALRDSEERLRLAVGCLATWDWNMETGDMAWSDECYRVLGYDVDEIKPSYEAWTARVHPDDRAGTEAALKVARAQRCAFDHEFRTVHADGSVHWCLDRGRFFYNGEGRAGSVVGPMPSVSQTLELLQAVGEIDAAVLDIMLRSEMVFPVADLLAARGSRFLFITGYDPALVPPRFAQTPVCEKPIEPAIISREVRRVLQPPPWFVAIGASGGAGLSDIVELLNALPADLNAIMLLVLHRPWDKPSNLKLYLQQACPQPVVIAEEGMRLEPGIVFLGEPSRHLTLGWRGFSEVIDDPNRQFGNRTVDLLFSSLANRGESRVIGVVLSGSLDDGSRGLAAINQAGGISMVVGPSSDIGGEMPKHAINFAGKVDRVGTANEIARGIVDVVQASQAKWRRWH